MVLNKYYLWEIYYFFRKFIIINLLFIFVVIENSRFFQNMQNRLDYDNNQMDF